MTIEEAPEYGTLYHHDEFYEASVRISDTYEALELEASQKDLSIRDHALMSIVRELQFISYSLWHLAKAAEPKPRDMVAEFGPFMQRYVARNGEISEEEARLLYQDFHGMQLEKREE